ncbi:hypothetical protein FRC07_005915 [Ceratobasidium sp. 392]|nr:hypothetical protein FRC07_005915 [Ceratobasidium sp. 392]
MSRPREHPFSKGSAFVEEKPRDPPPSHSALFALGLLGVAALSYLSHGYVNHFVTPILNPPAPKILHHSAPPPAVPSVVNLGYASYRGLINNTIPDIVSWLGVPYARPPRRFRAPQALDETLQEHNIEDKQKYPDPCVQGWSPWLGLDDRGGAGTEDCLKVNIYAPRRFSNTSSYPVLVYIHGGGFHAGSPSIWPFDNWVQRSPSPFVAVSIYYRLSALGFLASPDKPGKGVHAGPDPELLLNAGIHDQRLALKWIQKHIHAFGGDPGRVTIMGQSAGATSVGLHLVTKPQAPDERLFRRAILQSWYRPPLSLPSERKAAWSHITKSVGCSHWSWSTQRTLECLREADVVKLMQAADEGMAKHLQDENWTWRPVLDDTLLADHPSKLSRKEDVEIIVGHTTHDTATAGPGFESFSKIARAAYPKLSVADAQRLEKMYLDAGITSEKVVEFGLGEANFRCAMYAVGNTHGDKVYSYRFDEPDPMNLKHAGHSADNWMLFEGTRSGPNGTNTFNPLTFAQRTLSDETITYIVAFAATGDPNSPRPRSRFGGTPEYPYPLWLSHTSGKRIVFRAESGGTETRGVEGGSYVEEFDKGEVERYLQMKPSSSVPAKSAMWSLPTPPPSLSELSALAVASRDSSSTLLSLPRTNDSNKRVIRDYSAPISSRSLTPISSAQSISDLGLTKAKTGLIGAARQMDTTSIGVWLGLYLVCSLALTLHNKYLLNHFPFPWTLTAVHAFSAAFGSWRPAPLSHPTTPLLAAFSVLYSANIVASNASLRLVSIATHQVVRAATPLFVVVFAWIRTRRVNVSSAKLTSLTPVILGVVFATCGDYTFTRAGLALTLLGTALAALKTMLASWVVRVPQTPVLSLLSAETLPNHSTSEFLPIHSQSDTLPHFSRAHARHGSLKRMEDGRVDEGYLSGDERPRLGGSIEAIPVDTRSRSGSGSGADTAALHPLDVLFRLSPLACAQCLIVAWGSGEMARWAEIDMSTGFSWRELGTKLALNGALAFVLNYVSFMASRRAGALSMTVAANVKQVLTILLALLVFDPRTPGFANILGIGLTLAGGVWYGLVEIKEKKEKEEKVGM